MNNIEFVYILKMLYKQTDIKMIELCSEANLLDVEVYDIMNPKSNNRIAKILAFIKCLSCCLCIICQGKVATIPTSEAFAKWLKQARSEKRYSQSKLGKLVGCYYTTIASIENGKTIPTLNMLLKIIDVLECDIQIMPIDKIETEPSTT